MLSPETTLQDSEKLNGTAKHLPLSVSVSFDQPRCFV